MTAKTATARLYVALVSLVAALLELGAALARLGAGLLLRATVAVRTRPEAPQPPRAGRRHLRVVPVTGLDLDEGRRERLTFALTRMGFTAPAVRAFVDGLGDRVGREPIESLIKEGLASLAA